jgi:hypothetical protein
MEQYPAIRFMVGHGYKLAIAVGLLAPLFAVVATLVADLHWIWVLASLIAGLLIGFVFRTFVELTQVIADMLLPQ